MDLTKTGGHQWSKGPVISVALTAKPPSLQRSCWNRQQC